MLTNSRKISHITNRDIFQINFIYSDQKYDKSAVVSISAVFGTL